MQFRRFAIVLLVGWAVCPIRSLTEVRAQSVPHPQQRSYKFINGQWFNGKNFKRQTFYSTRGLLTHKKPDRVDEVIDLENGYVIPPFAEAHSHKLDLKSELEEQEARFMRGGTMYVMVLTNGAKNAASNRAYFNRPHTLDVLYANGGITRTGQHPSFAYERIASGIAEWWLPDNMKTIQSSRKEENNSYWFFDSVEDVNEKWPSYLASKPDLVKIYLLDVRNNAPAQKSISEEVAAHVVKKAHEAGLRVAAHIETFDDLKIGIRIGADIFAHLPHYNYFFATSEPQQPSFTDQELKAIRRRRIVLIPTLSLNEEHAIVRNASNNYQGKFDEVRFNQVVEFQKKTIRTLRNAGFILASGSDRDSLVPELAYWVKNRIFDSSFTLNAATVVTPQIMYPGRNIGMLREGYEANFLVLGGNPLQDFEQIRNIRRRVKQGYILND